MYLKDPKDKNPSVSLTITMAAFLPLLGFAIKLAIAGNVDPLSNLFIATAALYFGRRITSGKQTVASTKETENE